MKKRHVIGLFLIAAFLLQLMATQLVLAQNTEEAARQGQSAGQAAGQASEEASTPTGIPKPANYKLDVGTYLTTEDQNLKTEEGDETGISNIGSFVVRIVNFLSLAIGSFAFLALVVGGILMVTSLGKEEKITKGKDVIKMALEGLLIAFGAYWTTAFIQSIFYDI